MRPATRGSASQITELAQDEEPDTCRRRLRVLELEPVGRPARSIARSQAWNHAGVAEDDVARLIEIAIQLLAWLGVPQQLRKPALAFFDRLSAQVCAVDLKEVKSN
jgi:hypothetical protein